MQVNLFGISIDQDLLWQAKVEGRSIAHVKHAIYIIRLLTELLQNSDHIETAIFLRDHIFSIIPTDMSALTDALYYERELPLSPSMQEVVHQLRLSRNSPIRRFLYTLLPSSTAALERSIQGKMYNDIQFVHSLNDEKAKEVLEDITQGEHAEIARLNNQVRNWQEKGFKNEEELSDVSEWDLLSFLLHPFQLRLLTEENVKVLSNHMQGGRLWTYFWTRFLTPSEIEAFFM